MLLYDMVAATESHRNSYYLLLSYYYIIHTPANAKFYYNIIFRQIRVSHTHPRAKCGDNALTMYRKPVRNTSL